MRPRLLVVTTVPITLALILRDQPKFLNRYFDVTLATSCGAGLERVQEEGVPIHYVRMERGISPVWDLLSIFRFVRLLQKIRPDIVHSYTPKAGLVAMVAGWICRVPVRVHTFTGLIWPTSKGIKREILKLVDRLVCFCATRVVPEGKGVQRDLVAGRITRKETGIIGFGNIAGVDVEYFSRAALEQGQAGLLFRKANGIEVGEFVFIFVGRLNRDKGLKELLEAFLRISDPCRLVLVGDLDSAAPVDDATLDTLRQCSRVHWVGFMDDIRPALAAADTLVLPSYREGFPNVVLQAGAMELPVVATDINGSNEVVEPGLNGWLVPVRDSRALEVAMREALAKSKESRAAMGRAARSRVIERFEQGAHWVRMLEFYRDLYSGVTPGRTAR